MKNLFIGLLLGALALGGVWFFVSSQREAVGENEESRTERSAKAAEKTETVGPGEDGDGENAEEKTVQHLLLGAWVRTDDPQSTIIFERDGTFRDVYGGGAVNETGEYVFSEYPPHIDGVPLDMEAKGFITESFGDTAYHYAILEITESYLKLEYLERGTVLEYERG